MSSDCVEKSRYHARGRVPRGLLLGFSPQTGRGLSVRPGELKCLGEICSISGCRVSCQGDFAVSSSQLPDYVAEILAIVNCIEHRVSGREVQQDYVGGTNRYIG